MTPRGKVRGKFGIPSVCVGDKNPLQENCPPLSSKYVDTSDNLIRRADSIAASAHSIVSPKDSQVPLW